MNYIKFFELCKNKGIEEADLHISKSSSYSVSLFHGEIDEYEDSTSFSIIARGIYHGKIATASCRSWDKSSAKFLVKEIMNSASVIENDDPVFIFKGSKKYHKTNTFNRELPLINKETKIKNLFELEEKMKCLDPRISEVDSVSYSESYSESMILNSAGLKLKKKNDYFIYFGSAVAKDGEETKTADDFVLSNNYSDFDIDKLAKSIVTKACNKLHGVPCDTSTYQVMLDAKVLASFLGAYLSNANAEMVQKHSSLFEGKLNTKIASSKVTIEDKPLQKNIFASWFDSEGVATYNKTVIKNGKLLTYFHNLTTAKKDNVETTGNAVMGGGKMNVAPWFLHMKPGRKSKEELYQAINNGVLINNVNGLHAGLNAQTGNFSLEAEGFLIENGKVTKPLNMITVSGNLISLFNDIQLVGNDYQTFISSVGCPSVIIKKLKISGK